MFIIAGEVYDDEEILGNCEEFNNEEIVFDYDIDTYAMLSFIMLERFDVRTVCF